MCQEINQTAESQLLCPEVVTSTETAGSYVQQRGKIDLATAPDLERLLDRLRRDGHPQVTLDLSGLKFLGIAGLSVLLRADQALHAAGGRLVLTRPTRMVRRILGITGLDTTLAISEPTDWVAIAEYVNPGGAQ